MSESIDPAHTLFLVSSKSGGTAETNSFYKYFRKLVDDAVGPEKGGKNFVAITDPGTSLEGMAREHGFRRTFLNSPEVGGRYSVLSYFGLVPAALMGLDIEMLLDCADCMREGCASCVPPHDNAGAWLGAIIATLAREGRDKLTLVTSPFIASFGLWAEQLIAESTGKDGKGVVPVAGEPLESPDSYGDDRLFVYLRVETDDNADVDTAIENLKKAGQPVVRLDLPHRYHIGAEFFRWEFATAVAGHVIGINPFDQPNVQQAKDMTDNVLAEHRNAGTFPIVDVPSSLQDLLAQARGGDYLAIMAYVHRNPQVDGVLNDLRRKVMRRYRIATTLGYGPRFLHSTGQLHKGGPDNGLFLQITADHLQDVQVPGEPYTLGVLADAQALGDLKALQAAHGRRVIRVHAGPDVISGARAAATEVG